MKWNILANSWNLIGFEMYYDWQKHKLLSDIWLPNPHKVSNWPCLRSSSSSTLWLSNASTPCILKIWTIPLLNPHIGWSGIPFINSTTLLFFTSPSMCSFEPVAAAEYSLFKILSCCGCLKRRFSCKIRFILMSLNCRNEIKSEF